MAESWFLVLPPPNGTAPNSGIGYQIEQAANAGGAIRKVREANSSLASLTKYPASQWETWGPYKSQTEAQQKQEEVQGQAQKQISSFGTVFGNPFDALEEIGHFVGVLTTDLTDVAMWRSLGWIVLGAALTIMGIVLFLKDKGLMPEVLPIPV